MKKIVIGNWKMNPESVKKALEIALNIKKLQKNISTEVVVCPPFPFIYSVGSALGKSKIKLGAEDVSLMQKIGAFTGEVSASQIASLGASYVIIGHSERRAMGEDSSIIAKKALNALKAGLSPIICVGEKERHHDGDHWQLISKELHESLSCVPKALASKCVIAYEPIWAIGKGAKGAMTEGDIAESAIFIKKILAEMFGVKASSNIRVVYGGSVDIKNAKGIASAPGISGFLVGRESLVPAHFAKIIESIS